MELKPNLQHTRIFGFIGYVPNEKRKKLAKKSVKMLLVAYDNEKYRIFAQNTKKITISRDVQFDEYSEKEEKRESFVEVTVSQKKRTRSFYKVYPTG